MNYQTLFYWLVVADNAKSVFFIFAWVFLIFSIVATLFFLFNRDADLDAPRDGIAERAKKWMWWSIPIMFILWTAHALTPSKRDALLIVAGGQTMNFLTTDSAAKQLPSELSGFLVTEIRNMAAEVNVDLKTTDVKAKILEEAKAMAPADLINKMKTDTTFAKVVLNQ